MDGRGLSSPISGPRVSSTDRRGEKRVHNQAQHTELHCSGSRPDRPAAADFHAINSPLDIVTDRRNVTSSRSRERPSTDHRPSGDGSSGSSSSSQIRLPKPWPLGPTQTVRQFSRKSELAQAIRCMRARWTALAPASTTAAWRSTTIPPKPWPSFGEGRISDGYATMPEGVGNLLGFLRLHANVVHSTPRAGSVRHRSTKAKPLGDQTSRTALVRNWRFG